MRLDKLTTLFQQALGDAQSLAVTGDQQFIEPVHLLLALLAQQDGGTASLLARAGVNVPGLKAGLEQALRALPQVSGNRVFLNIGIHEGIALRRAKEDTGSALEIAALLAELSDGIVASGVVIAALKPELRALAQPCKGPYPEIAAHSIDWRREIPTAAYGGMPVSAGGSSAALSGIDLLLRHNLKVLELTRDKPVLTVGRDPASDLVLAWSHVSRNHCRIERLADRILLADTSSNGSFVTPDGGKERRVLNASIVLTGKGLVFFGRESRGERRGGARYEVCS